MRNKAKNKRANHGQTDQTADISPDHWMYWVDRLCLYRAVFLAPISAPIRWKPTFRSLWSRNDLMLRRCQFLNMRIAAAASVLLVAVPLAAQETAPAAPLSVIDWLGTQAAATPRSQPRSLIIDEVPVAKTGSVPEVSVVPLGDGAPREIGLVPSAITGLPPGLWAGSDVNRLKTLIEALPDLRLPAAQSLLFTVLLAEAQAPKGGSAAGDALALFAG